MMWERCTEKIRSMGGHIRMGKRVTGCRYDAAGGFWEVTITGQDGSTEILRGDHVISSIALRELGQCLSPKLPGKALQAAQSLRYRDFLTVGLILKDRNLFPDNWIYIHDPKVKMGRIQNYKSWSPEMVPDPAFCCYGLEYFCFEGDGLWNMADGDLIQLAKSELEKIGLAKAADVEDGCVIRQRKAYPVYDDQYATHVETLRRVVEEQYPNLHLVGRNGMHKYNNQDHAMMTAMLTAKNILAGKPQWDVWLVNQDAEYHEAGSAGSESAGGLRLVPSRVKG
jgi:protoporphyrinogen oxidase